MRTNVLDGSGEAPSSSAPRLPERREIDSRYQWRPEAIYPSLKAWEADYEKVRRMMTGMDAFRGRLGESAETLLACLRQRDRLNERIGRLILYAGIRSDEDSRAAQFQALRDRVAALAAGLRRHLAFIQPEILSLPEGKLWNLVDRLPELGVYRHHLEDIKRRKAHVLPQQQEQLLALAEEFAQGPYNIFSMFNYADIRFPRVKDESGQEIELTQERFQKLLESGNRRVRKNAFLAFYGTYEKWLNTLAATLAANIKKNVFYAKARRYASSLEAALDEENIPPEVYQNLVDTMNQNLTPLHRYIRFRGLRLHLSTVYPWDLYVPLGEPPHFNFSYEEAVQLITEALQPLGESYQKELRRGFSEGWIDVFENRGKRAGAYSWSTYGVHPFILLNYDGTLRSVFTLAHEMGHALHSYFTQQKQPFIYSQYDVFVAEVASTLNEALVIDYLLNMTREPEKKLYLLNQYADQIVKTVYIQTLFAEFEKLIHERVEAGEALTSEFLCNLKEKLYRRYFGKAFSLGRLYCVNWCRIPHFYYGFYVYKYVTGYSAAVALSQRILSGDVAARNAYLDFLSRGGSDYPLNLLKDAGVDLTRPEPLQATAQLLDRLVEAMETMGGIKDTSAPGR